MPPEDCRNASAIPIRSIGATNLPRVAWHDDAKDRTIDDQRALALNSGRVEAAALQAEAATTRASAWRAFEASVYAEADPIAVTDDVGSASKLATAR
jgi:post-segregation antitoxin (ccd killing protein)